MTRAATNIWFEREESYVHSATKGRTALDTTRVLFCEIVSCRRLARQEVSCLYSKDCVVLTTHCRVRCCERLLSVMDGYPGLLSSTLFLSLLEGRESSLAQWIIS